MYDKIINHKKSIAQHTELHSSISKFSCSTCKKDFKFKYFKCFSKGNFINSTLAAYSRLFTHSPIHDLDVFRRYFVTRHKGYFNLISILTDGFCLSTVKVTSCSSHFCFLVTIQSSQ